MSDRLPWGPGQPRCLLDGATEPFYESGRGSAVDDVVVDADGQAQVVAFDEVAVDQDGAGVMGIPHPRLVPNMPTELTAMVPPNRFVAQGRAIISRHASARNGVGRLTNASVPRRRRRSARVPDCA